ncbi:MAG: adenosylcobinamide-phosphate synthase CbiB [Caldimicrobium sp.]|nr:adenosylcobinamide-phosphate synthase CbiB [Caldimicrobium sp.]MCX7614002.1 adenosylcobinamide-phosphate synthase CbiB [Caldimicrobium sp.]MDW8182869.1 adenosylcobinamide-phosphate synthase CbiB [Caldimicrobium sp.]
MFEIFNFGVHLLVLAVLIDLILGDPPFVPHPISAIGKLISTLEPKFRTIKPISDKLQGVLFFFAVVAVSVIPYSVLTYLVKQQENYFWGEIILVFLASQFIALRGLVDAGKVVDDYLKIGDINRARDSLKSLVGRDTTNLSPKEIRRAVLESYAENLNDAVISPLFWLFVLGLPGLVLFKTVSTLDSMVGYKNERYLHFGWFSAKMDDLLNYIPARITALLIVQSSFLCLGLEVARRSLLWVLRYASLHPSPNAGYPEAALAGALGVRLLGPAYYEGKLVNKPTIGRDQILHLEPAIKIARKILYSSTYVFILFLILIEYGLF